MKRYIYIILGIIIVAIIAIGILFLLKGNSALTGLLPASITGSLPFVGTQGNNSSGTVSVTTGFGSSTTSGTSSSTGMGGIAQSFNIAADGPFIDYFVDEQGNVTGIEPSGQVIKVSGNQSSTISSSQINDIISASFSYDGDKLLVNFGDPSDPQTAVLNVASGTWTSLPLGIFSPQWSSSNYQIAFLSEYGAGSTALDTMDASNPKKGLVTLLSLSATDLSLRWISKNQFIISDKPSIQAANSAWLYNSQLKTLSSIMYETPGLETTWSRSTTTIGLTFFQSPSSQGSELQLIDTGGNDLHNLNFLTLPTKCLFNNETSTAPVGNATTTVVTSTIFLYCGIPSDSSQLSSAQLPDDYNDGALFTSDKIIKLNTNTGGLTTLWDGSAQNVDAVDLKFFNNTLYFISRYDQRLYSLTLTQ